MNIKSMIIISSLIFNFITLQSSFQEEDDSDSDTVSTQGYENSRVVASRLVGLVASTVQSQVNSTIHFPREKFSLTAAQLAESKRKQKEALRRDLILRRDLTKIEVGTTDAFHLQIDQSLIYQNKQHRSIGFDVFYKNFTDVVAFLKQEAQVECTLSQADRNMIYLQLARNRTQRDIKDFKIIGHMPSNEGFQDSLFNVSKAKEHMFSAVREYIDQNYKEVRKKCIGSGLATTTSKDVWAPGCCDLQLHRSCFKQCQHNNVGCCINPFCQKTEDGTPYSLNWTSSFYAQVLERNKALKFKKVRDIDCPVCMEPLKPEQTGQSSSSLSEQSNGKKKLCVRDDNR